MLKQPFRIVLASGSPRRKELFGMICNEFEVIVSDCEEVVTGTAPEQVTQELSGQKAEAVAAEIASEPGRVAAADAGTADAKIMEDGGVDAETAQDILIIGADTVVSIEGKILGKPDDRDDACAMLRLLSGKKHKVTTGITLICMNRDGRIRWHKSFAETTVVCVDRMEESEIQAYLDTDEPYDKAGAYGIQGLFGKHISGIEGDYNNVVGLPVHRLYKEIRDLMHFS